MASTRNLMKFTDIVRDHYRGPASCYTRSKYYVTVNGRLHERTIAWVLTGKEMIQLTSVSQGGVRGARVGLGSSGDLSDREIEGVLE